MKKEKDSPVSGQYPKKEKKFKFKIPQFNWRKFTIFVFLPVLLVSIGWLVYQLVTYRVYRVMVSNVSSRSATISWVTEDAEPGMVVYREGSSFIPFRFTVVNADFAVDDRDYSEAELQAAQDTENNFAESGELTAENIESRLVVNELGKHWTHHVTIRNLDPETEYEFLVGNGVVFKEFMSINTDSSSFTTGRELEDIETPDPAYGVIRYYDEDLGYIRSNDASVYVSVYEELRDVESQFISSTTNVDGGWYIDLSNALTNNGDNFFESLESYGEATQLTLRITTENAWFGRWSKEIKYPEEVAPADVIDLNSEKESSGDLIYEGLFFPSSEESSDNGSLFVNRVYARLSASQTKYYSSYKSYNDDLQKASNLQSTYEAQASSEAASGNDDKAAEYEAKAKAVQDAIDKDQVDTKTVSSKVKKTSSGSTGGSGDQSTEGPREEAQGDCLNDICLPEEGDELQCGYVTNASCDCTCSDGNTEKMVKGQYCKCVSGSAEVFGEELDSLEDLEGANALLCSDNDLEKGDSKDCYSSVNRCYYTTGTQTKNGETCIVDNNGETRWGDSSYEYTLLVEDENEDEDEYEIDEYLLLYINGKEMPPDADEMAAFDKCAMAGSSMDILPSGYMVCQSGDNIWRTPFDGLVSNYTECKAANGGSYESGKAFESCEYDGQVYTTSKAGFSYDIDSFKGCVSNGGTLSLGIDAGNYYFQKCTHDDKTYVNYGGGWDYVASNTGILVDGTDIQSLNKLYVFNSFYNMYEGYSVDLPEGFLWWDTYVFVNGSLYEEKNGEWTLTDKEISSNAAPGGDCSEFSGLGKKVIFPEDPFSSYKCKSDVWVKKDEDLAIGVIHVQIGPGDDCLPGQYCTCIYGDGEDEDEKFTGGTGKKCTSEGVKKAELSDNLVLGAYADEREGYVINTKDGIVEQLGVGHYIFIANGDTYLVDIGYNSESEDIYLDVNGNEELDDEDLNVMDNFEQITVDPIIQEFGYSLKEGFNFVSFPFIFERENINTASSLLEYLNHNYSDSFYSISKFDSGRWQVVGSNGVSYDQNDFQIIPGEGYLLKSKWDQYFALYGKEIEFEGTNDSAPIRFIEGWNLVGLYGTGVKSYTAQSMLEDISDYDVVDFTAVNVSRWLEERSMYEGLQREADGSGTMQVYGLDFPIQKKEAYFVKVTEGSGNWEPGLR